MKEHLIEEAKKMVDEYAHSLNERMLPEVYDQVVRVMYMRLSIECKIHHNVARKYIYKALDGV